MRSLILITFIVFSIHSHAILCKNILSPSISVHTSITKSLAALETLKELKLIKEKNYLHAKKDLEAGAEQIRTKKHNETFSDILTKWDSFLDLTTKLTRDFKSLPEAEQRIWKKKLEAPLFFSVGHFVTFLESSDPHVYQKINSILDHMNSLPKDADPKVVMFEFEKQALRFFSVKEFKRCKF